jgi:hypothetical protein
MAVRIGALDEPSGRVWRAADLNAFVDSFGKDAA